MINIKSNGIRGSSELLTPSFCYCVASAVTQIAKEVSDVPFFVIGKDTRKSGNDIENSLAAGICAAGGNCMLIGVCPTAAVSFLTRKYSADFGIMITASHCGRHTNGIKFFDRFGYRINSATGKKIQSLLFKKTNHKQNGNGEIFYNIDGYKEYADHIIKNVKEANLRVVLDCANGSAVQAARRIFTSLGATVTEINTAADGINDKCGSVFPQQMAKKVLLVGANVGFAFDGDADRVVAADEKGNIISGDGLLYVCAIDMYAHNVLTNNSAVGTVLTNSGVERALSSSGIKLIRSGVGDKNVIHQMLTGNYSLGGENCGHMIFSQILPSSDGILAAALISGIIASSGLKLSELTEGIELLPQINVSVDVKDGDKYKIAENIELCQYVDYYNYRLKKSGRLVVRASDTESKIRITAEGDNTAELEDIAAKIRDLVTIISDKHI